MTFLNRKAQSSFELSIIVAILLLFTVSIFAIIQVRMSSAIKERNDYLVQGIGNVISTETDLANSINGDYYREFTLPFSVEGKNYTLEKTSESDVVITIEDSSQVLFLNKNVTGVFSHGKNVIRKINGVISVN